VFLNRTKNLIADFEIGMNSSLVDEQGYQYSPCDNCFYSISGSGSFNKHANFLAPHSKIDGTILFPQLRKDSTKFVRWFLRGRFWIDKVLQEKNYDISLI
jgi:alpha-acetolactate decarboxylase